MKTLGLHLMAEFSECSKELLDNRFGLEAMVTQGLESVGISLKQLVSHQFEPIGVTVIAIIGESHICLHTYP